MHPQLNSYLRQLLKLLSNQSAFYSSELITKLTTIETDIKHYLSYPMPGRLSFLLKDCTCPTPPNLIKPNSAINPTCPVHKEHN